MNTFTKEQQARGGRNGKRGKTAATYGKKLVAAFLEINDPLEQVKLLKQYSTLPEGVCDIAFYCNKLFLIYTR